MEREDNQKSASDLPPFPRVEGRTSGALRSRQPWYELRSGIAPPVLCVGLRTRGQLRQPRPPPPGRTRRGSSTGQTVFNLASDFRPGCAGSPGTRLAGAPLDFGEPLFAGAVRAGSSGFQAGKESVNDLCAIPAGESERLVQYLLGIFCHGKKCSTHTYWRPMGIRTGSSHRWLPEPNPLRNHRTLGGARRYPSDLLTPVLFSLS